MRTFLLTYPGSRRLDETLDHLTVQGYFPEVFMGFNGLDCGLVTTVNSEYSGTKLWPNHIGCTLTHLAFYKFSYNRYGGDGVFLLLEDDVRMSVGADDLHDLVWDVVAGLPKDWGIINLGAAFTQDKPKQQVNGSLWSVLWPLCTHAMVVNPDIVPTLAKWSGPINEQIDVWYWQFFKAGTIKPYCILPRLAEQHETPLPT